jgi:hypothetical protein
MQNEELGFNVSLPDNVSGQQFDVRFAGQAALAMSSSDPFAGARVPSAIQQAVQEVLSGKLMRNELALPTLAPSLPYLTAEITQRANALLQGAAQISSLNLQATVPQQAIAPAAAAIAAAPTPMQSVGAAFQNAAANHVASHVPSAVKFEVGGFKVKVGKNGVDGDGLASQVLDKAQDKLIGCAVVGGVVLLLGLITAAVLAKVILFG